MSDDKITGIRIEADRREIERREMAEENRRRWRSRLDQELKQSRLSEAALALQWSTAEAAEDPHEQLEVLRTQKAACDAILDAKNRLIKELETEISLKDDEYIETLKNQRDEISRLIKQMRDDFSSAQAKHKQDLADIESDLTQERHDLVDTYKTRIDQLMEHRRKIEETFVEEKKRQMIADEDLLDEMRRHQAEESFSLRMQYWADIQAQDLEIERMRTVYQLNSQRLEFNQKHLQQQSFENDQLIRSQKRKIARLRDYLMNLQHVHSQRRKEFGIQNKKLTAKFMKMTSTFKILQKKFAFFLASDERKFLELRGLNESRIFEMVQRLFVLDRIITEHILLQSWSPPESLNLGHSTADDTVAEQRPEEQDISDQPRFWEKVYAYDVHASEAFVILWYELRFVLVDSSKLQGTELMEDTEEARNTQFEIEFPEILKLLRVRSINDLRELVGCLKLDKKQLALTSDPDAEALVSRNEVLGRVKVFVESLNNKVREERLSVGHNLAEKIKLTLMKLRKYVSEEETYWEKLVLHFGGRKEKSWKLLKKSLHGYIDQLEKRRAVSAKVSALAAENAELKQLLNHYLASDINQQLYVPPADVIRLETEQQGSVSQ